MQLAVIQNEGRRQQLRATHVGRTHPSFSLSSFRHACRKAMGPKRRTTHPRTHQNHHPLLQNCHTGRGRTYTSKSTPTSPPLSLFRPTAASHSLTNVRTHSCTCCEKKKKKDNPPDPAGGPTNSLFVFKKTAPGRQKIINYPTTSYHLPSISSCRHKTHITSHNGWKYTVWSSSAMRHSVTHSPVSNCGEVSLQI